jgi:hypothetical protein
MANNGIKTSSNPMEQHPRGYGPVPTTCEVFIMNKIARNILLACVIAAPAISFAQTVTVPVTHAQEVAQLAALEKVGYDSTRNSSVYPADVQAAEARLQPQATTQSSVTAPVKVAAATSIPRIDQPRNSFYFGA